MKIAVVGISCEPPRLLSKLSNIFSAEISFEKIQMPKETYDSERKSWSAEKILNELKRTEFKANKIIGTIDVDIFVRGLNFVFGLSEIGGRNCLISLYRLRPEFYGEKNEKLFEERALKECIHELGHTFCLQHCPNKKCVMSSSNSIEEVDKKGKNFCENCTKQLSLI